MIRALLLLGISLATGAAGLRADAWKGGARVSFEGTSTLHDWAGRVAARPFVAEVTPSGGQIERVKLLLEVPVAEMDTDNEGRDENLRKAMRAEEHPRVLGGADVRIPPEVLRGSPGKVPIELTLLGKRRAIEGTILNWRATDRQAAFDCEFTVSLAESGIEIPPFLFLIRVGDSVKVRASFTLTRP